jgi:tetratricopeptide (TPR) repeat protein
MPKATTARALVMLWIYHATAGTTWAQSKPVNFRPSGAFCGTAYAGGSPQFSWPVDNDKIDLIGENNDVVVASASTDATGGFKFLNVPPGIYRVGLAGFSSTQETVRITRANQRDCKQPLFVSLMLGLGEAPEPSRILAKRPLNFANATTPYNKEGADASAENSAGLNSDHDLDQAEPHFRAAIRIDPSYWLAHINLALVLVERGKLPEAEAEFREAVRVGGRYELPYWQLTTFLVDHKRERDAEAALNEAKRNGISSAGVIASRGLLAFQKHLWKEAEKQFRAALEFTPEALFGFRHWEQWNDLLAVTLSRQGKSVEAAQLPVTEPWAQNEVGYAMVERGVRVEEAARMLEEAVAAEPDNPRILDSLGWANFKLRRFEVAEPLLKNASERLPTHSAVLEHLGELYAATGRTNDARAMFVAALKHATDAEQRKRLSRRLKQLN